MLELEGVIIVLGVDCAGGNGKAVRVMFGSDGVRLGLELHCATAGKGRAVWGRVWHGGDVGSGSFEDCTGGKGKDV